MLEKPIDQIKAADLQALVDDEVHESKTIEFKEKLWGLDTGDQNYRNKQKIEFLKDVSAFANTGGGHVLVGIQEKDSKAVAIPGIEESDTDNRRGQLSDLLESWIRPRIAASLRYVPVADNKYVLVIAIEPSTIGPHCVTYDAHDRFYKRNSRSMDKMDVDELRTAFTMSQMVAKRIRDFRLERANAIAARETPIELRPGPTLILHIIPEVAFTTGQQFSLQELRSARGTASALGAGQYGSEKINLDGLVDALGTDTGGNLKNVRTYLQLFRNGTLEAADSDIAFYSERDSQWYWRQHNEANLIEYLPEYLGFFRNIGIRPPLWLFVSITSAKKIAFPYMPGILRYLDRNLLLIPEIRISDLSENPREIAGSVADYIWNAAGFERCMSLDKDGNWKVNHSWPRG